MAGAERIAVEDARLKTQSGAALLVCAYDDEEKCESIKLEGAISMKDLRSRAASLPKDRELIFYCA